MIKRVLVAAAVVLGLTAAGGAAFAVPAMSYNGPPAHVTAMVYDGPNG